MKESVDQQLARLDKILKETPTFDVGTTDDLNISIADIDAIIDKRRVVTEPGIYAEDIKTPTPTFSPSSAHTLISRSPLHCWHRKFVDREDEFTKAKNRGSMMHSLILGGQEIVVVEAANWRKKVDQEQRDSILAVGKLPCLPHELEECQQLVSHLAEQLQENDIALTGVSEANIIWFERGQRAGEDFPVMCRGRMDHWIDGGTHGTIIDFKFVEKADPAACARKMMEFGSHIQAAAYKNGIETLFPNLAGRVESLYVFVEIAPPFGMTLARPDGTMRKLGESQWYRAVETWNRCLEKYGEKTPWPAWGNEIHELAAPQWLINQEMEHYAFEPEEEF